MEPVWRIELFGGLRVASGERVVTRFRTRKAAELLAYLAYHLSKPHSRDALVDLLWPDCEFQTGRSRLSNHLTFLRRAFEPGGLSPGAVLLADRASVRLDPTFVTTDVAVFEAALRNVACAAGPAERVHWLTRAVETYGGELLHGFQEAWVLPERERLAQRYFQALSQFIAHLEQMGDFDTALTHAHRGLRFDPLREETHRDLIRLYLATDHPDDARRQYAELERLLKEELDAVPSPITQTLAHAITERRPTTAGTKSQEPRAQSPESAPSTKDPAPSTVPAPLTRFFGREEELARLRTMLLVEGRRLVTLTGPGGSGKTRLALEAARRLASAWPDAVWFVPLADLIDARHLGHAIRDSLQLPRLPAVEPLEQVIIALSRRPALLLLDNVEHLVEDAALLVRTLLQRLPALTCLATSRRCLAIEGEREFPVLSLPVPSTDGEKSRAEEGTAAKRWSWPSEGPPSFFGREPLRGRPLSSLTQYPSVQLFIDRAQAVCPDFQVTPENADAVVSVCRQLDGIPLALELAASQADVLTPAQMVTHLHRRFDLLVSRHRDAAARHRTLRATMDWSYQLLPVEIQRFFARLSGFQGGWTAGAAAAVCEEPRASEYLVRLRESSLILAEPSMAGSDVERRFRMLETLREYAREQLTPNELIALQQQHLAHFLTLAELAEPKFMGPEQGRWLAHLQVEHPNLRAALSWAVQREKTDSALRLSGALWWFWYLRGHLEEGRGWIDAALEARKREGIEETVGQTKLRAKALHGAGVLACAQRDDAAARSLLEESLSLWRKLGDRRGAAYSLNYLGLLALWQGNYEAAGSLYEANLSTSREIGEKRVVALSLHNLGLVAHRQLDFVLASVHLEEALATFRQLGDPWGIAGTLCTLGYVGNARGDNERARCYFEEALSLQRDLGDMRSLPFTLNGLGLLALDQGDYERARSLYEECLDLWRGQGKPRQTAWSLIKLGQAVLGQGNCDLARSLYEESLTLARAQGDGEGVALALESLSHVAKHRDE